MLQDAAEARTEVNMVKVRCILRKKLQKYAKHRQQQAEPIFFFFLILLTINNKDFKQSTPATINFKVRVM